MSADWKTVAAGAHRNHDNGKLAGHVGVFKYSSATNQWNQEGNTLHGLKGDWFGFSVSLSSDGKTLAVGAIFHGKVDKYQVGAKEDWFGLSVSLSSNGNILAAGAP